MLQVGMKAPDFTLVDTYGKTYKLSDYKGQKVVLYFYPKDLTGGCTTQALNYKDEFDKFVKKGIMVFGISKDSVSSHKKFVEKYDLPFVLLSDEELVAINLYDVWHEKSLYGRKYMGVVRTTYVIDENGIIIHADDKVKVKDDATCLLKLY